MLSVPFKSGYNQPGIRAYAFYGNSTITSIELITFPNIYSYAFAQMTALERFSAPLITSFSNRGIVTSTYIFSKSTKLKNIYAPLLNTLSTGTFEYCSSLESLDTTAKLSIGGTYVFSNCTKLSIMVFRNPNNISTISNLNSFTGTPFASGGTGGTIYIPKVLYDELGTGSSLDYKAATNWSTIDGYGTITWAQIEGSEYENYYADGTAIT